MLKIPPVQEKRQRASVGAVVKKTRFGKVNVGSILANMMVKFPQVSRNNDEDYSMPSYTKSAFGNFPSFLYGPFYEYGAKRVQGAFLLFFYILRYDGTKWKRYLLEEKRY